MKSPTTQYHSAPVAAGWALALALALAGASWALADAPLQRDGFQMLLESIDEVPPSREALEARWPDAKQRLLAVAMDDTRQGWSRLRALSFLSFFPDADTRAALEALATHPTAEVRRLAVYTAGRAFGQPGDAALVRLIEAAATDPVADVRDHAIRALRWVNHSAALMALERIRAEHPLDSVRELADRTLARRARRIAAPRPGAE